MLKLLALAVCVAAAAGKPRLANDNGDMVLTVDGGKTVMMKVGDAETDFASLVTNDKSSKSVSFMHLGYSQGYKEASEAIEIKIKAATDALDKAQASGDALADDVKEAQAKFDKDFGDEIKELEAKLAAAASSSGSTEVKAVSGICTDDHGFSRCAATGGQEVSLAVEGEVYSNAEGVFVCTFAFGSTKLTTTGMGHIASASGKLSSVTCETPAFSQAFLAEVGKSKDKNKWDMTLSVSSGGEAVKFGGPTGSNKVTFYTVGPEFTDTAALTGAELEIFAPNLKGGKVVESPEFTITDPDTESKSFTFTTAGVDKTVFTEIKFVSVKTEGSVHTFRADIKGTGAAKKSSFSVKVTVADQNGNTDSMTVKVKYAPLGNVMVKLTTTRGGKVRSWHDTGFWEAKEGEVNGDAGRSSGYKSYGNDIKTKDYYAPLGARLDLEFYQGSSRRAVASYDIAGEFQGVSLRDLVAESKYNQKVIGKKNRGRSSGRFYGSLINGNDGNCRPRKGDGFVDQNYDLRVRMRNEYNSQDEWDRIGFVYNGCKGGHIFGGIGGTHKHGGWTVAYEVMPIVGYCNTWNGYGSDNHGIHHPRGGAHPYRHCGGWRRRYNIDVAITRGLA